MRENRSRPSPLARSLVVLAIVVLGACGGTRHASASRDPVVISRAEVATSTGVNAYEIVSQLRPGFLHGRGHTSVLLTDRDLPVLYVDDVLLGSVERLREFAPRQIDEIRYLSASEAQVKWGSGHPGGVILLRTVH